MNKITDRLDISLPTVIKVLLLSGLGFVCNLINLQLFASISFIFGGIFVLFAVLRFGMFWGVVCALISNIATYFLWGHFWGVVYFTCEAIVVGYFYTRKRLHIVLGDIIYWLTIGCVLIFTVFYVIVEIPVEVIISVYLKCFLNGILYSLLASMLDNAIRLLEFSRGNTQKTLSVRYAFFEIIVIFITIPSTILLTHHAKEHSENIEKSIKDLLNSKAGTIEFILRQGSQDKTIDFDAMTNFLHKGEVHITVVATDINGKIINNNKTQKNIWIESISDMAIRDIGDGVFFYKPRDKMPALKSIEMSAYFKEIKSPFEGQKSIFIVTYLGDSLRLQSVHISNLMTFSLALILISIAIAHTTSSKIIKPLQMIVETAKSIPEKVVIGREIALPHYFIYEFDFIAQSIKRVLNELIDNFKKISAHEQKLQLLVEERTRDLKVAKDLYKNITENINDIIYRLKLRPNIVLDFINPAVTKVLGYPPEELLNNTSKIISIIHPDDRRKFRESILKTKRYDISTLRWISKSGNIVYLEHKNTYNYDLNGRVINIDGIARDVTERRRLEELFRESANRFRVLFEQAPYAVFIIDVQNNVILDSNTQAEKLLLMSKNNIFGRPLPSLFSKDMQESIMQNIKQLSTQGDENVHSEIIRADGKPVPVNIISNIIEIQGKQALCCVFRDISERKKYEQDMKNAILEKEMLIREIHHRVKNNMQVILSLIHIQSSAIEDKRTRAILSDLDNRIKAMAIVHETLYQSKDLSNIDLKEYIGKLIDSLNSAYGMEDVSLIASCDNIVIRFEQAIKIGLILNEMIANAFKHAFKGVKNGLIQIKVFMVDDERLRINISDNGIGINEDMLSSKTGALGFQLLSLMAKQLSGEIDIKSGNGTEISITIRKG